MGILVWLFVSTSSFAAVTPPAEKPKVIVEELKNTEDVKRLLVPVKVEAKLRSVVTAEIEGWVTKIKKPLGTSVKKGEVVLYIENKDPSFTFAAVPVRSPVNGVVSQMDPSLMSKVARGEKLFSVIDPGSLKLAAEIPGADLAYLKPGAAGQFKADLSAKAGLPLKVTGVSPLVDPRTGTAPAELEFATAQTGLPAIGSVGHALFEISRGKVLLIPESAVGYSEGKPIVKVLGENGKVVRKNVELGEQKESFLVISGGITEGEKVILRASRTLKDGDAVDVEKAGN